MISGRIKGSETKIECNGPHQGTAAAKDAVKGKRCVGACSGYMRSSRDT